MSVSSPSRECCSDALTCPRQDANDHGGHLAGAATSAEGHLQGLPDRPLRDMRAGRAGSGHGVVAEPPPVTAAACAVAECKLPGSCDSPTRTLRIYRAGQ